MNTLIVSENTLRVWKILESHKNEIITVQQIAKEAGIHQPKVVGAVNALVLKNLVTKDENKGLMLSLEGLNAKPILKQPQKMSQTTQRFLNYFKTQSNEATLEELAVAFDCLPELVEAHINLLIDKGLIYQENHKYILK